MHSHGPAFPELEEHTAGQEVEGRWAGTGSRERCLLTAEPRGSPLQSLFLGWLREVPFGSFVPLRFPRQWAPPRREIPE